MPKHTVEQVQASFWSRVNKDGPTQPHMTTPCWEWTATRHNAGYGQFAVDRKIVLAHRFAMGSPDGCVLHHCDNRLCCRPEHLYIGDRTQNAADRTARGRSASGDQNGARTCPQSRPRGESHGRGKLMEADVLRIRRLCESGETQQDVADLFGIKQPTVSDIVRRRKWTHI